MCYNKLSPLNNNRRTVRLSIAIKIFLTGVDIVKSLGKVNDRTERRDAAVNRQRILDTAQKLFEQNGVEQVSMNQIAIEAQIGAGTLYRRYRNKSELCLDLIKDKIAQQFEDIDKYMKEHYADPPCQRLKEILRLFICFIDKDLQWLTEVNDGAVDQNRVYNEMHEIVVKIFSEMTESEQSEPNNVFRTDMLLFALLRGYSFQKNLRGYSPESFLEQICLTFFPTR